MSALAFSRAVSILVCSLGFAAALTGDAASQGTSSRPLVSEAQFEAWQTELSNWGRWGKDDELGTLNLITPAKRRAALALVKEGVAAGGKRNTFIYVNNRLEGNALETIAAMLESSGSG